MWNRYTIGATLVLTLAVAGGCRNPNRGTPVDWSPSIPLGIERAAESQTLFVYFKATWCQVCSAVDRDVFTDPEVQRELASFVPVKIDIDQQVHTAKAYNVDAVPMFLILDRRGKVLGRTMGLEEPAAFAEYLRRSAELLKYPPGDTVVP